MCDSARHLACQILWLLLLLENKRVHKSCVTIHNLIINTCSLLDFLKAGCHSPKMGLI